MPTAKMDPTPGVGGGGMDPMTGDPAGMMPSNGMPKESPADTLKAAGLDVNALPPLTMLTPEQLQAVMTSFTVSLGVDCTGCHMKNDFKAATREKNIAANMWEHFARGLEHTDGSALYCDSCHAGKQVFLDRSDSKKLSAYMTTNFVKPLKRRDGKKHDCSTCHGNPFVDMFLDTWAM